MIDALLVLTTTAAQAEAETLAAALVERKLAACVQITGPIQSVYRWQERLQRSSEWHCVIKTNVATFAALEAAIKELHSYETPEIIALPITAGSAEYLAWLNAALR